MHLKRTVTAIMKAPRMLLLLCCFFYPMCAQVYIEKGTELSIKDSAFYSIEEKLSKPDPVLYIVEGTEIHNVEKISDVKIIALRKAESGDSNRSLLTKTDRRNAAIPKVTREKQKAKVLSVQPEAYISQNGSSVLNVSEYAEGSVVFAANTFQVKQGIASEKYKVFIITTEEAFVSIHSRKEYVRKINSLIVKIRPPPF